MVNSSLIWHLRLTSYLFLSIDLFFFPSPLIHPARYGDKYSYLLKPITASSSGKIISLVVCSSFLPLNEAVAFKAVFVIVSELDKRTETFWSQLDN